MYVPLKITTDYTLLKSMIKIDDLIKFSLENKIEALGICDENLSGVMEFYNKCLENNIKPIIGLEIVIEELSIYLYAKDYIGYQTLLKLNTISGERINLDDLRKYSDNVLVILPYKSISFYSKLNNIYEDIYLGYQTEIEKASCLLISSNIVFINNICALKKEDTSYLNYLNMIREDTKINDYTFKNYDVNSFILDISLDDEKKINEVANLLNVVIPKYNLHVPTYNEEIEDSFAYLCNLTKKGLSKRLNDNVLESYTKRLEYELDVIKKMGFVDYILIVYDYVLFAKKNNVFVGPGRGSAAGSLVCYTLGITDIDPLKYNLLFERFLNSERITMPDIDIDFENTKRGEVIQYIKSRYGKDKVASILTFATLKSKLVIREIARVLDYNDKDLEILVKEISSTMNLEENLKQNNVLAKLTNKDLKKIYKIALKLEGLKKNISTHAAGVVISNTPLETLIPIIQINDTTLTGITMEYLEELGLLKMDLLAIKNLTIIANILELIKKDTGKNIALNKIDLNDQQVINLFTKADTTGIFQFESNGMRNFLQKLKPRNFNDLIASLALYRPGPMDNIGTFIKRKEGLEKIDYLVPSLEPILKETEGIIVYQEQVMQILVTIGSYSFAEADLVRRAMSKKKKDVMALERDKFIKRAIKNGYKKEVSEKLFNYILKFAGYGFNKSHSVSYALIGYQMAFLKVKFPKYFITNLLNMSIASEAKTKEYLIEAKRHNLNIIHPDINISYYDYVIRGNDLVLPLSIIKGINRITIENIIDERTKNGEFLDFVSFIKRMYNKNINEKIIIILINAGVFSNFANKTTLKENLSIVLNYASIASEIDSPLIMPPVLKEYEENEIEHALELESFGFYITNHPTSVYHDNSLTKLNNIENSFDKYIKCIVLIETIKRTKTKNNEDMAFIAASDETGISNFVVFNRQIRLLDNLKPKDIVMIQGRVTKRFDKYQINVNNIIKNKK